MTSESKFHEMEGRGMVNMNRTLLLRIANYLLFLSTCALIGSGLLLESTFEGGGPQRLLVAGLTKHDWAETHFILGLVFIGLSALHIVFNWGWIVKVANQQHRLKLLLSVGLGMALIVIPLLLPTAERYPGDGAGRDGSGFGLQRQERELQRREDR